MEQQQAPVAEPTTLQEAVAYFAGPANCRAYLVARRWPNWSRMPEVRLQECPVHGEVQPLALPRKTRYSAVHSEDRHHHGGFPHRLIKVAYGDVAGGEQQKRHQLLWSSPSNRITQKSAWFLDHRIRFALGMAPGNKLSGQVEADETFIGGKARNMHASKRARKVTGTGGKDKTAVMGILERGGKVRTAPRLWTIREKDITSRNSGTRFGWLCDLHRTG